MKPHILIGPTVNTMGGRNINLDKSDMPDLILTSHKDAYCYMDGKLVSRENLDKLFEKQKK